VTLLDRTSLLVDGVRILGCTLWSAVPAPHAKAVMDFMADYRVICPDNAGEEAAGGRRNFSWEMRRRRSTFDMLCAEHARDAAWLEAEVRAAARRGEPVVVLTHHAPLFDGTSHPRYPRGPTSHGFATDMSHLFAAPAAAAAAAPLAESALASAPAGGGEPSSVRAWAFGHTHFSCDFVPAGSATRIVANQRGYRGSVSDFYRPDFVLEVS